MCSNDPNVTDFEVCSFSKNTKIQLFREGNRFSSNEKIHSLRAVICQKIVFWWKSHLDIIKSEYGSDMLSSTPHHPLFASKSLFQK